MWRSWRRSLWAPNCTRSGARTSKVIMETIVVGSISLALFVYLFIAMVYPEKF